MPKNVKEKDYACVLVGEHWHCTQDQANPPVYRRGSNDGGWTICGLWGDFIRGFDKRRPTCQTCLKAVVYDEETFGNPIARNVEERPRQARVDSEEEHEVGSTLPVERGDVPGDDTGNPVVEVGVGEQL